jgi:hypothetical protein
MIRFLAIIAAARLAAVAARAGDFDTAQRIVAAA